MNKRVYISGPITNMPNLNRDAFYAHAAKLASEGVESYNPHDIPLPANMAEMTHDEIWQYFMRECVRNIPNCTVIHMLPKWGLSRGARWEHNIAEMLGLEILYLPDVVAS